eukprot:jgi/Ulvmu1/12087/UM084_0010.1
MPEPSPSQHQPTSARAIHERGGAWMTRHDGVVRHLKAAHLKEVYQYHKPHAYATPPHTRTARAAAVHRHAPRHSRVLQHVDCGFLDSYTFAAQTAAGFAC